MQVRYQTAPTAPWRDQPTITTAKGDDVKLGNGVLQNLRASLCRRDEAGEDDDIRKVVTGRMIECSTTSNQVERTFSVRSVNEAVGKR